jgi:hypothetical protein
MASIALPGSAGSAHCPASSPWPCTPTALGSLWAIPGVKRHQIGDHETRAIFPPEALEQVAGVIKARRKRALSREAARKLGAGTAYRSTSGH